MQVTYPAASPAADISRLWLRQIVHWIREELDPIVAREGPDVLRADDVLILHDTFQSLRTSTTVSALDLRATGIHKAILDISGIATRWPGRLIDDCDRIISVWTAKFGRLEGLRPFLYGRGGRLEDIASIEDFSKDALVKRWQNACPERIAPKKSHRGGDLGFRAGSWWINPLFAWHAGIIDFYSVEGGFCYDKYAAYALLLKDKDEIQALSLSSFTYRCGPEDKGKFRLTAATQKSRGPIRVLRSHNINSIWTPKAGVRYDGLYQIVGWTIHMQKLVESSTQQSRSGEIIFDIKFERDDPVPVEEVVAIPTANQVDEYLEYKRLRSSYRNMQRQSHTQSKIARLASPISPLLHMATPAKSIMKVSPSVSRTAVMKGPASAVLDLDKSSQSSFQKSGFATTPTALTDNEDLLRSPRKSHLALPLQATDGSESLLSGKPYGFTQCGASHTSSAPMGSSHFDTREVMTWTDYDVGTPNPNSTGLTRTGSEFMRGRPSQRTQDSSINSLAKLPDGAEDREAQHDYEPSHSQPQARGAFVSAEDTSQVTPRRQRARSSNVSPHSPSPQRPVNPPNLRFTTRRDAVTALRYATFIDSKSSAAKAVNAPFRDSSPTRATQTPLMTPEDFISRPLPSSLSCSLFSDDHFNEASPTCSTQRIPESLKDTLSNSVHAQISSPPMLTPNLPRGNDGEARNDAALAMEQLRSSVERAKDCRDKI